MKNRMKLWGVDGGRGTFGLGQVSTRVSAKVAMKVAMKAGLAHSRLTCGPASSKGVGFPWRLRERVARRLAHAVLVLLLAAPVVDAAASPTRSERSLCGDWLFQTNGAPAGQWKHVRVPSSFESHEGTNFNGVGWYRLAWRGQAPPGGDRLLLHFEAAATEADVWVNDRKVGRHLGGWTPFRFDVTEALRAGADATNEIRVRLDEKVGHNTQGFLPIVQPHFGGLWREVSLLRVPPVSIDDLSLRAAGNPSTGCLELDVPLVGETAESVDTLDVKWRLEGERNWQSALLRLHPVEPAAGDGQASPGVLRRDGATLRAEIPVGAPVFWSPRAPVLYEVGVQLPGRGAREGDAVGTRAAFRSIQAVGDQLRLNGVPLNVRGLLNWGYYPPRLAPFPDEGRFRRDLAFARERGFNLMKFCLWVPPRRYLEMCDEFGMLAWMEYPTWHPQLTPEFLEPLRREFIEFFQFDRNHPSVILRSLTCETGPGADLGVIQSLYDLAHAMIPGAVIEDDSSWIEWNRVSDFFDDHPYGNNHTWVRTVGRLRRHAAEHGPKPLVLGEAMAADTWVPRQPLENRLRGERPYWTPAAFDRQPAWMDRMRALAGPGGLDQLLPDSLRYAWLMRKYQVESFRREAPHGGYVISVIRDIPKASMGLIDFLDRPKWTARDWDWQGDTICLLETQGDCRSFEAGGRLRGSMRVSHFGVEALDEPELAVTLAVEDGRDWPRSTQRARLPRLAPGSVFEGLDMDFALPESDRPVAAVVQAEVRAGRQRFRNHWPVWIVPRQSLPAGTTLRAGASGDAGAMAEVFPGIEGLSADDFSEIRIAARFDDGLVEFLERGGRALMLPDGGIGSFRLSAHWFLRGAPYVPGHALMGRVPRALLVELQHFDLAGDVILDLPFLDQVDPVLLLWDTHDHGTVKTHGLVFESRVGKGRLLVSALRHGGAQNAAGRWLAGELVRHLAEGESPRHAVSPGLWNALKAKLHEDTLPFAERVWRFKPDPRADGVSEGWAAPTLDDSSWAEIRVGAHWESQGHPGLDHWAWYRLDVEVPERWRGRPIYLTFEGVDDCYELFVDGQLAAKRGDPTTRQDTFNETFSHDLTARLQPGASHCIAVRVYDWYGAGGIFRPVTLGTAPYDPRTEVLK